MYPPLRPRHERRKLKKVFHDIMKEQFRLKCQFPQAKDCREPVIESHSIQRGGALKSLCDRSNHVIGLRASPSFDEPPKALAKRVGINKASIFFALCSGHDQELFAPIETKPLDPENSQHLFLLAYRGFLREYYAKHSQVFRTKKMAAVSQSQRDPHPLALDFSSKLVKATTDGLRRIDNVKSMFNSSIINSSWDQDFRYWHTILPGECRVAAGSNFTPEFDFQGRRINEMLNPARPLNTVSITICPLEDGTLISTCIPKDQCAELVTFYTYLEEATGSELEVLVSDILLRYCENVVFSPSHWEGMPEEKRETITDFFNASLFNTIVLPFLSQYLDISQESFENDRRSCHRRFGNKLGEERRWPSGICHSRSRLTRFVSRTASRGRVSGTLWC